MKKKNPKFRQVKGKYSNMNDLVTIRVYNWWETIHFEALGRKLFVHTYVLTYYVNEMIYVYLFTVWSRKAYFSSSEIGSYTLHEFGKRNEDQRQGLRTN